MWWRMQLECVKVDCNVPVVAPFKTQEEQAASAIRPSHALSATSRREKVAISSGV